MTTNRRLIQLIRRVVFLLASDDAFWAEVHAFLEECGAETESPASATTEPKAEAGPAEVDAVSGPTQPNPQQDQSPVNGSTAPIATHCRLKTEGCRWLFKRLGLKANGADHMAEIAPGDRAILEKAKELHCYLWMNSVSAPIPDDWSLYETLAGCFETLAAALTVAASSLEIIAGDRHLFEEFLKLVAEAQSAVREAVRRVGGPTDPDQVEAYWWLRDSAAKAGIFIERYMRVEDPADPTCWKDLLERINGLAEQIEQRTAASRKRRKLFEKLRYQLEQAVSGDDNHLWESVARTLDELIADGVPPSNLEVRELLLPHLEVIPQIGNPPKGFELVLRETRRFQESSVSDPPEEDDTESIPIVEAAADMLKGRAAVLIGGDSRQAPKEALERRLRLSELVWVPTKHGQSVSSFESYVARPDVAVVLLAIRWASHAFTDVRHICRKYDKPLVRLPGGYGPNQVAIQLLNQCSWRLKHSRQRAS